MKSIIKNLSLGLVAGLAIAGLSACQDDIDTPRLIDEVPVATMKPNSTILEVKNCSGKTQCHIARKSAQRKTATTTS